MNFYDILLAKKLSGGGGGDITTEALNVTANGQYTAPQGKAYTPVNVNIAGYKVGEVETPTPIATFNGTSNPLKSLTANIVPVQAGSGDPSPTNIRPISGWDEANVTRCGKNLIPTGTSTTKGYVDNSYLNADGTVGSDNTLFISEYFKVHSDVDYAWSSKNAVIYNLVSVCFYDENKNYISGTALAKATKIITTPSNATYCRSTQSKNENNKFQFEVGSTATTYEPYNGTTTTIPFTDSQGNPVEVYGGTLDVTSGVLTITWKSVKMNTLDWFESSGRFLAYSPNDAFNVRNLDTNNYPFRCTEYTPSLRADNNSEITMNSKDTGSSAVIRVKNTSVSTVNEFEATLTDDSIIIYELATPITIQLNPTAIKSLDGDNNVFASTGDVEELKYFEEL